MKLSVIINLPSGHFSQTVVHFYRVIEKKRLRALKPERVSG